MTRELLIGDNGPSSEAVRAEQRRLLTAPVDGPSLTSYDAVKHYEAVVRLSEDLDTILAWQIGLSRGIYVTPDDTSDASATVVNFYTREGVPRRKRLGHGPIMHIHRSTVDGMRFYGISYHSSSGDRYAHLHDQSSDALLYTHHAHFQLSDDRKQFTHVSHNTSALTGSETPSPTVWRVATREDIQTFDEVLRPQGHSTLRLIDPDRQTIVRAPWGFEIVDKSAPVLRILGRLARRSPYPKTITSRRLP